MSQLDFVYGVFENAKDLQLIVADLHKAGFKEVEINVVGKDCPEFHHQSAKIKSPQAKYFVKYGIVGAFAGLWAGVNAGTALTLCRHLSSHDHDDGSSIRRHSHGVYRYFLSAFCTPVSLSTLPMPMRAT